MKKRIALLAVSVALVFISTAGAQEMNSTASGATSPDEVETPGTEIDVGLVAPDSVLYQGEIVYDDIMIFIGLKAPESILTERTSELKFMSEKRSYDGAVKIAEMMADVADKVQGNQTEAHLRSQQVLRETIDDAPQPYIQELESAMKQLREASDKAPEVEQNGSIDTDNSGGVPRPSSTSSGESSVSQETESGSGLSEEGPSTN